MNPTDISRLSPSQLAQLLDVDSPSPWPTGDAAAILRHQLSAPLLPDLTSIPGAETARLKALIQNRPGAESFARQLTSINPSLELLQAIKRFARSINETPGHPLHGNPAMVLYYAAIAAGILRCKSLITQLPRASLREGFAWAADQPGAEELRSIFTGALEDPSLQAS
jgi:hypothetical protein